MKGLMFCLGFVGCIIYFKVADYISEKKRIKEQERKIAESIMWER